LVSLLALLYTCGCAMKSLYVVEVGDPKIPRFPDSCIICGLSGPEKLVETTVTDEATRVDFFLYSLPISPAQGSKIDVPVHDSCAKTMRNRFLKEAAATVMVAGLIIGLSGIYGRYLGAAWAIGFGFVVAFWMFQSAKMVPFEFNRTLSGYIFTFADHHYAERVAALNGVQIKTGTDPYTGR
jgi:hypothetical protein